MRRDLEQGTSSATAYTPSSDARPTTAMDGHAAAMHAAPRQPSLAKAMRPRGPVRTMTLDEQLFLDMQRGCRG